MRHPLILLVIFIFSFGNTNAQPAGLPDFVTDSLDTYVQRALKGWKIPGVAVGIVKGDHLVFSRGYGVLEMGKSEKVDANTLFMIGSNTKAFTGTALAMLVEDGKCSLDDRVENWLPTFEMQDDWVEKHVTLADLVSHRLGMETFQGDFTYWTSNLNGLEVMERFGRLEPMYDFRAKWGYCNAGFLIAGLCMEPIGDCTWSEMVKERIFIPLDMKRSLAFSANLPKAKNAAKPHTVHEGELIKLPYPKIDNLAPAGSISSSVNDMSHWVIAHLNKGVYDGGLVISPEAIELTRKPLSIMGRAHHPFNKSHYQLYGMGWVLQDYEGTEIVSHTGGVNGFVTSVTLLPEHDLGIIVLTNSDQNAFYEALKWEIVDAYLDLPYRNYSGVYLMGYTQQMTAKNNALSKMRDTVAMKPAPVVSLDKFTGHYENDVYGCMDISRKGDYLEMALAHHTHMTAKLEPLGGKRFLCTFSDPTFGVRSVWFDVEGNEVKTFTLRVAQFVEFTTYEFEKME